MEFIFKIKKIYIKNINKFSDCIIYKRLNEKFKDAYSTLIDLYRGRITFITLFRNLINAYLKRSPTLKRISQIAINLTYKCNLSCYYCFTKGLEKKFPNDMKIEDFHKLIRWLKVQKRNNIQFIGGEPTFYPQFGEVLDICKREDMKVDFFTNNLFDNSIAEKLDKSYIKGIQVNYNPPSFYTEENYKRFEDNLKKIHEKNIGIILYHKVSGNNDINHLIKTAKKYNAVVGLSLFIPGFSWQNTFSIEKLKNLSKKFIEIVSICRKENISCTFVRPVPRCMFTEIEWKYMNMNRIRSKCYVGLNNDYTFRLVINPDLSIFPCSAVWLKGPNILSFKNLKEVSEFYKEPFEKLRWKPLMKRCKTCKYFISRECQGGCLNYKIKQNVITYMK